MLPSQKTHHTLHVSAALLRKDEEDLLMTKDDLCVLASGKATKGDEREHHILCLAPPESHW